MAATNHDMKELEREAKRQGWKIAQSGSNHLRWTPPHGRAVMTSLTPSNNYAINMIERDLKKAGLKLGVEYEKEEKKMPSVAELIKANGNGESIVSRATEPVEDFRSRPRKSRAGLDGEILTVLRGAYPSDVDFTTLKMKVSMNQPGVNSSSIHTRLNTLKAAGKVVSYSRGIFKATSADVQLDAAPTVQTPLPPLVPVLPAEAKAVIDGLVSAVEAAEKLIVRLTRQLNEQSEASEAIKRLAARL